MTSKLITGAAALLAAGAIAACGSSSSSSSKPPASSNTSAGTTSTTGVTTHPAATVHGTTVTRKLDGTAGHKLTVADVKHFVVPRGGPEHAHLQGMQGLSLTAKINFGLNYTVSFWQQIFGQAGGHLSVGNAALIQDQPVTCGSQQWTSSSAPGYCQSTDTLLFPLGTITSNIAPLGDGAILLMTTDLYGYHVENALGAFQKGYTTAQLEEMDSCFSGLAFAGGAGSLQASDEQSVNSYLALEATTTGTSAGSGGAVSADELTASFNKGFTSVVGGKANPQVCVPS